MKIQIISFNHQGLKNGDGYEYFYSKLDSPKTFDAFDLNLINLQQSSLWNSNSNSIETINSIRDFVTLETLINGTKNSKTIVCFPQNYTYSYYKLSTGYQKTCKLKDMINAMLGIINVLIPKGIIYKVLFENHV